MFWDGERWIPSGLDGGCGWDRPRVNGERHPRTLQAHAEAFPRGLARQARPTRRCSPPVRGDAAQPVSPSSSRG
jgi:hypothetical protein